MKTSQYFSHRPPSKVTLLSDPWPAALKVRKHRKTFEWPAYRGSAVFASARRTESVVGLQA